MAKSIADQLLGLGLADKKQIKKDQAEKRKQAKQARKHKQSDVDEAKLAAEQARKEKAERDRALNKERDALAEQKAIEAQVLQMVQSAHIPTGEGDVKFNFADRRDNKIKSIYVTQRMQDDLARGRLVICHSDERYWVVTQQTADKIAQRSPDSLVFQADKQADTPDEDDPYKDFVIPDDLMW